MKFDKLLEMLTMESPTIRESPIRKKGRPDNLEATTYSQQMETPTRSNKTPLDSNYDEMDTDDDAPSAMSPIFVKLPDSPTRHPEHPPPT